MGPAQLLALNVPPPPTKPAEPSVERQQERQERMAEEEDKKTGKDLHALLVPAGGGGGGGGVGGGRWFKVLLGAVLEQQQQQEKGLLAGQEAFAFVVVGPGLLVPRQLTAAEERDLELRKYASGDFYQYLCQSMPIPYGRAPHSCVLGNRCMYRFQARGCRRLHDGDPRWVPTRLIRCHQRDRCKFFSKGRCTYNHDIETGVNTIKPGLSVNEVRGQSLERQRRALGRRY